MAIKIPHKKPAKSDREPQEVFYTVQDLASRWQLTPRHIRRLIAGSQLAALHIGRAVRIRESAVADFERKCRF